MIKYVLFQRPERVRVALNTGHPQVVEGTGGASNRSQMIDADYIVNRELEFILI